MLYEVITSDPRAYYRFLRLVPNDGITVSSVSEPFFCQLVAATPEVAAVFGMAPGDQVLHIKRVLRFAGEKVIFDQIFLPAESFPGLSLDLLRASERSLYRNNFV